MPKRKQSAFLHIGAILFLTLMLAALGLLALLWSFLAEYEQSTPRYAGEQLLSLYRAGDYGAAMELAGVDPEAFFDSGQYEAYIQETLGDLSGVHVQEGASREGQRTVLLIGRKTLRFSLTEAPETLGYGLSRYIPVQERVPVRSYTVRAPAHVTVTVNGKPLPAACRTGTETVADFPALPEGLTAPEEVLYRAEGFAVEPEWALADLAAGSYRVTQEGDAVTFTLISEEEACGQLALEAAKAYAKFVSRDAELADVTRFLYPGTVFHRALQHYSNIWYNSHNGVEFAELRTENAVAYSPDYTSVEVAFDYVVYRGSESNRWAEWRYPTRYRAYLIRTDGGWKALELRGIQAGGGESEAAGE